MYNMYGRTANQSQLMLSVRPTARETTLEVSPRVQQELSPVLSDMLSVDLALAVPTADQLVRATTTLEQLNRQQIEDVCALSNNFKMGLPQIAQDFLNFELQRIEEQYEKDMEAVNVARTVTEVMGWLVSAGAVIVSVVGTPALGVTVGKIAGASLGVTNKIIEKIADGIEKGIVDPQFVDQLAMITKDESYFQKFYEKFYNKSLEEIESLIVRSYRTYQEILLIPELQMLNTLKLLGFETIDEFYQYGAEQGNSIQSTDEFLQSMIDGFLNPTASMVSFPYYASKAEIEIILVVLCQLYEERRPQSSPNDDNTNIPEYDGDKFKLTPLLVGLAVGIGTFLV